MLTIDFMTARVFNSKSLVNWTQFSSSQVAISFSYENREDNVPLLYDNCVDTSTVV